MTSASTGALPSEGEADRRQAVLESALQTFARYGYRKTSMDDVATAARISRPGLYFLFDSKPVLFREAVAQALDRDLEFIAREFGDTGRSLSERVIAAFDRWAGSYIGPLTADLPGLLDSDRSLLGPLVETAPRRFEELLTAAIRGTHPGDAVDRARTLISTSIGIKHQVESREDYRERMAVAVELLLL